MPIDAPLRLYLLFFLFWGLVFFAFSEASLFGLGRLGVEKLKEKGHPRYEVIRRLLDRPRRLIISLLIGNEALNVAISSLTSAVFIILWGDSAKWVAIPVVVFLILLFGEVVPKSIAVRHPEKIAPVVAPWVDRLVQFLGPLHWVVRGIMDLIFKIARIEPVSAARPLTEEDFKNLVETGQKEGTLEEAEKHMIHRVFRLGDQTVKNIMTPRSAIFALPESMNLERALQILKENRFSRIPVYRKNLDEITGILFSKDLLRVRVQGKKSEERGLRAFLRKPYFVPLSKKLDDLLREFQRERIHMAIVVDEYGKTAGIVTLEDLLEELFGEIYDELDLERSGRKKGREISFSPGL